MLERVIGVVSTEIDVAEGRLSLGQTDNVAGGEASGDVGVGLFERGEVNRYEEDAEGSGAQYAWVSPRLLSDLEDLVDPVGVSIEKE
ncbi:hypothetical protein NDU88_000212 [Pleurodeles waltl]|uniref:Uncharacterized protein n=1 Tax=Pleurodeles waltl TaxID=8319 RepID=A0AAV7S678_PLEWA|nr:hypothetical protein NDU88_000212 [Pleurodeles waltl]